MPDTIIRVEQICKKFQQTYVLENINLEISKGEICGLIGRNGSGKTMLLKCICGFVIPTSGKIFIHEEELNHKIKAAQNMGIIIETPGFLPDVTGFQNLKYLSLIYKKIRNNEIIETMEKVGLDASSKKKVGKYSLGMRQRLGIAQAIMENPEILILDEPMNGLDNQGVDDMRKLFMQLKDNGTTILLASHNREDIGILCNKVLELDKGRIVG